MPLPETWITMCHADTARGYWPSGTARTYAKEYRLFGAVKVSDGCLVTIQEKPFNSMTFLRFMEKILPLRKPDRKMVVILDNARWHHAKALNPGWQSIKISSNSIIFLHTVQIWTISKEYGSWHENSTSTIDTLHCLKTLMNSLSISSIYGVNLTMSVPTMRN